MKREAFGIQLVKTATDNGLARAGRMAANGTKRPSATIDLLEVVAERPVATRARDLEIYLHQIGRRPDAARGVPGVSEGIVEAAQANRTYLEVVPTGDLTDEAYLDILSETLVRDGYTTELGAIAENADVDGALPKLDLEGLGSSRDTANADTQVNGFIHDTRRPRPSTGAQDFERMIKNALQGKFRSGQPQRLDIVTVDGRITLEDLIEGYEDHLAVLREAGGSIASEYRFAADGNEFFAISVRAWDFSGETPRTVLLYSAE